MHHQGGRGRVAGPPTSLRQLNQGVGGPRLVRVVQAGLGPARGPVGDGGQRPLDHRALLGREITARPPLDAALLPPPAHRADRLTGPAGVFAQAAGSVFEPGSRRIQGVGQHRLLGGHRGDLGGGPNLVPGEPAFLEGAGQSRQPPQPVGGLAPDGSSATGNPQPTHEPGGHGGSTVLGPEPPAVEGQHEFELSPPDGAGDGVQLGDRIGQIVDGSRGEGIGIHTDKVWRGCDGCGARRAGGVGEADTLFRAPA